MSKNIFQFLVVGSLLFMAVAVYQYTHANSGTPKDQMPVATIPAWDQMDPIARENFKKSVQQSITDESEPRTIKIIMEAAQAFQEHMEQEQVVARKMKIPAALEKLEKDTEISFMGSKDAPITIYEFVDYNCGYCRLVAPMLGEFIKNNPDVRIKSIDTPMLSPTSYDAALGAYAANQQGLFPTYYEKLMSLKSPLTISLIESVASDIGADVDLFKKDMNGDAAKTHVDDMKQYAVDLQISGTPSFIIGKEFVPGAITKSALTAKIQALRDAPKEDSVSDQTTDESSVSKDMDIGVPPSETTGEGESAKMDVDPTLGDKPSEADEKTDPAPLKEAQ